MSSCESIDRVYEEATSRLGLRIRGPPPASRTCSSIISCLAELASKLGLPGDVVGEAERIALELAVKGYRVSDVEATAVAITCLACRLKGYALAFKHIVRVAEMMGWRFDRIQPRKEYLRIMSYTGITPPPQSREQARQALQKYHELLAASKVEQAEAGRAGGGVRQALEQPPPPFHVTFIKKVAEELDLAGSVVDDAIRMVERVGDTRRSVVATAVYLSCLKHDVEVHWSDIEGYDDVGAKVLVEALGLDDYKSFLAVRAYMRIMSWAEAGCIQVGRYYVRYIPKTRDGVVKLKWTEFMNAFDVAPTKMAIKVSEELVRKGVARVYYVWSSKFVEIDLSKLRLLLEWLAMERIELRILLERLGYKIR